MNFYVEALQDEHKLLESVLDSYRNQLGGAVAKAFEALRSGSASRLMFCGMGSSYYAALSVIGSRSMPRAFARRRTTATSCSITIWTPLTPMPSWSPFRSLATRPKWFHW